MDIMLRKSLGATLFEKLMNDSGGDIFWIGLGAWMKKASLPIPLNTRPKRLWKRYLVTNTKKINSD